MKHLSVFVVLLLGTNLFADDDKQKALEGGERKIANQILKILDQYKLPDPVRFLNAIMPDSMAIPKMKYSFSEGTIHCENVNVYGLRKYDIVYVKSELSSMRVNVNATFNIVNPHVRGNCTMTSQYYDISKGLIIAYLRNVSVKAIADLGIERDGKLRAQDIKIDTAFGKLVMEFHNLGLMGSTQGILNSIGTFLLDSIKTFLLKKAHTKINTHLNKVAGDMQFPNSISPLDMLVAETRNKIRSMELDPIMLQDYRYTKDFYKAKLSHTWITGLSSFYRVGNISLSVENYILFADFEVGTQKLEGQTHWDISFVGGVLSRAGSASFSVDYVNVGVVIGQYLYFINRPQLKNLYLEVGNIQVRFDGAGTLDYIVELAINVLPNLLRNQIVDAIEGPIIDKVQEKFNQIDVESIIKDKVSRLNDADAENFKLSLLKDI